MARYIVSFGAVGAYPQGTILTDTQTKALDADHVQHLVAIGALREATADELKAQDVAADLPAGTAKKAAALAPDSPALTTGQPGGAPVGANTPGQLESAPAGKEDK